MESREKLNYFIIKCLYTRHFPPQPSNNLENLFCALKRWFFYSIDVAGKQTFVDADGTRYLRDI